jgi:hypothetical protein
MTLTIRNHRVTGPGVRFLAANSYGGPITPQLIVLHDTAGRLDKGSSVGWFRDKECTTSQRSSPAPTDPVDSPSGRLNRPAPRR